MTDISKDPAYRRIDVLRMKPAELAILNAMGEIEKLDADVRLTNAVVMLSEAKKLVSDFIDEREPK